jgi:hypothetical protein
LSKNETFYDTSDYKSYNGENTNIKKADKWIREYGRIYYPLMTWFHPGGIKCGTDRKTNQAE